MKSFVKLSLSLAMLSACVAAQPPTQSDVLSRVSGIRVAQICIDTGRTRYLPETLSYMQALRGGMSGASVEQVNAANTQFTKQYPANKFDDQSCRSVEVEAVRHAQQQAERQRQRQESQESFDQASASWGNFAPTQSRPVTCQHHQWGNTTFCN